VPVGDDQKQHLELARDIAQKFNNDFGVDFFPVVEPLIFGEATRVMSLRDGSKKMSKSDPSDQSRITLTDDADAIAKKVRKAKTDPDALPTTKDGFDGRPEAANLMGIYAALSGQDLAQVIQDHGGHQFSQFKQDLANLMVDKLQPITAEMRRLTDDPGYIDGVLKRGAEKARALSEPIMAEVHDIVGFLRP
jgi:tryptophanyl-tRNA synthetase